MKVAAIIVTRGDVDLKSISLSLPDEWEMLVWDNGRQTLAHVPNTVETPRWPAADEFKVSDLSVYGRYAAIEYTDADLIYVQDDDCIVSDPQALVDAYQASFSEYPAHNFVVCNMPPEFRHDFYTDHALVGFGAVFHRDAPQRAFEKAALALGSGRLWGDVEEEVLWFRRTCDIVFTGLTPRVLVDVPKTNLWWAEDSSRMYRQPQHVEERLRMLELVKRVRDAS